MPKNVEQSGSSGYAEAVTESPKNTLPEQNAKLDREVKEALVQRKIESAERHYPKLDSYPWFRTRTELQELAAKAGYDPDLLEIGLPTTKALAANEHIDWAVNVVRAARQKDENPVEAAKELAGIFTEHPCIAEADSAGPFINLKLDYAQFGRETLDQIAELGVDYGRFRNGDPRLVLVDYSGPNVAKDMTLAHLRSTIIGESMAKITESAGDTVLRVNHLGDWGAQFGMIIYEYQQHLATEGDAFLKRLESDPTTVLLGLYRDFTERAKQDTEETKRESKEAQKLFLKLEEGDPEFRELWSRFRVWSLDAFVPVYERLRIKFDTWQGESFYEDRMLAVVEAGVAAGVLKKNKEGSIVFPAQPLFDPETGKMNERIMDDKQGNPNDEVILKPSGGTVYITRDLAAIRYRREELGADQILYVVGKEQKRHFKILFAMAEQLGYIERGQARHLDFGHLNVDGKKMKSRSGLFVLLDAILDDSIAAAEELILERKTEDGEAGELTPEERETARRVGIAAVEFNDLRQDRRTDIEYSPEAAKTFESGGSPYIQYTYARLRSIERKAATKSTAETAKLPKELPADMSSGDRAVLRRLAEYPETISEASEKNAPHRVGMYLTELAKDLNSFYRDSPVLSSKGAVREFRLALVAAARQVFENGAEQLHIELPERM